MRLLIRIPAGRLRDAGAAVERQQLLWRVRHAERACRRRFRERWDSASDRVASTALLVYALQELRRFLEEGGE